MDPSTVNLLNHDAVDQAAENMPSSLKKITEKSPITAYIIGIKNFDEPCLRVDFEF